MYTNVHEKTKDVSIIQKLFGSVRIPRKFTQTDIETLIQKAKQERFSKKRASRV